MSEEESGELIQLSRRSVSRNVTFARAWLKRELSGSETASPSQG